MFATQNWSRKITISIITLATTFASLSVECSEPCCKGNIVAREKGCLNIVRGSVCVTAVQRGGGTDNPVTQVSVSTKAGAGFTASTPGVTSQDIKAALQAAGITGATAALAINIPVTYTFTRPTADMPVVLLTPQNSITSHTLAANNSAAFLSVIPTVSDVTNNGFTANVAIVAVGSSNSNIWDLVAAWLLTLPGNQLCDEFVVLAH